MVTRSVGFCALHGAVKTKKLATVERSKRAETSQSPRREFDENNFGEFVSMRCGTTSVSADGDDIPVIVYRNSPSVDNAIRQGKRFLPCEFEAKKFEIHEQTIAVIAQTKS